MDNLGIYLYCFIQEIEGVDIEAKGIWEENDRVYTIGYKSISAVVSNTPIKVYKPEKDKAFLHQNVINNTMKNYDVIPVAFGHITSGETEVRQFIEHNYEELEKLFKKIKNKIEVGLKVFWEKEKFSEDIETDDIKKMKEELMNRPEKEIYFEKAELGRMVQERVLQKREDYIKSIYVPLSKIADDSRLNSPITVMMVLNAAFLVNKEREAEFDLMVNEIYSYLGKKLKFSYTGPWPPYNFASMRISSL